MANILIAVGTLYPMQEWALSWELLWKQYFVINYFYKMVCKFIKNRHYGTYAVSKIILVYNSCS